MDPGSMFARLPRGVTARPRRHGRRVPGHRPVAAASGRAEADRTRAGARRALSAPLPEGTAARRLARSPQRDPHLRGGRARRTALPGDALRARKRPQDRARARTNAPARAGAPDPDPDRRRPRRRPPARTRAPRRQAGQHPAGRGRARVPDRLRHHQAGRRRLDRHRRGRPARSTTWPPSRSAANRSTPAATNTRSRACSTSAWPARRRSGARRRPRACGRTCRRSRRRCRGTRRSIRCCARRSRRRRTTGIRAATS